MEVSDAQYDEDGNPIVNTTYPTGSTNSRVTRSYYDWRDRLIAVKAGVQDSESTSDNDHPITVYGYDNLNELTSTQSYDGDAVPIDFPVQTPPSISDPSFESPGGGGSDPTGTGWSASGDWEIDSDDPGIGTTPDGEQFAFAALNNQTPIAFSQSVGGWSAGTYTLSFYVAEQDQGDGGPITPVVSIDGNVVLADDAVDLERGNFVQVTTPVFDVPSGTHTLSIQFNSGDSRDSQVALDDVQIQGVETPRVDPSLPPPQPDPSLLRSESTTSYDNEGRVYKTSVFSVNPSNGDVSSDSIDTNTWYDLRGNVIKTQKTAQAATKTSYDGADRPTVVYTTDAGGDAAAGASGNWSDAGTVTGDTVLEQDETAYDADNNPIETIQRQRFHDDTGTGALGTPSSGNHARDYYSFSFYDGANRLTATANYGTNGGSAPTTPSSVPSRSDTILVNSYTYNPAGWVNEATDPRGVITKTNYDALGRTTKTIVNYDGTGVLSNSANQTTAYTYDGDDHVTTQTAILPGSAEEQTQYNYGVTVSGGNAINSNDLLANIYYPDLTTGIASSDQAESYTYDAVGEKTGMTDRDGTTHAYSYDLLGRQTLDATTTVGDGVDSYVQALGTAYNSAGQPYLYTSYGDTAESTIRNQVEDVYNGLGQLITEYQADTGAVDTSSTPKVQTGYSTIANGSRKSDLVYPNGRQIDYNYASGLDASVSRLSSMTDDSTGNTIESYKYLGAGTVVERDHPLDGIDLTYINASSTGDGGDQYVGLDRFGRVVDQKWVNGSGTAVDEYQYGYDRDGNALYKLNAVNTALSELYTYDDLNRLTSMERGTLASGDTMISGTPSHTIAYTLDALGNQIAVTTDGSAVTQAYNQQNELIDSGGATLAYDANGNMTTDEKNYVYTYDAWNRMVYGVYNDDDDSESPGGAHTNANPIYGPQPDFPGVVVTPPGTRGEYYRYDALDRRILDGQIQQYFHYDGWNDIEDDSYFNYSPYNKTPTQQVWSPVYQNALIEQDSDADRNTATGIGGLEKRLFVTTDANYDTTGIFNTSGTATERMVYDPYGQVMYLNADFSAYSGVVTAEFNYLFQGGKLDNSDLYYFQHRDEDPVLGDWAEQDVSGASYSDGDNLYLVEQANPQFFTDPAGTQALPLPAPGEGIYPQLGPYPPPVPFTPYPPSPPFVPGPYSGGYWDQPYWDFPGREGDYGIPQPTPYDPTSNPNSKCDNPCEAYVNAYREINKEQGLLNNQEKNMSKCDYWRAKYELAVKMWLARNSPMNVTNITECRLANMDLQPKKLLKQEVRHIMR